MVNNSVLAFENKKVVLNPNDEKFKKDLEGYRLKGVTSTGAPIFSDENEHTIDAMNLAMLIFEQNHGTLFKDLITARLYPIDGLNPENIKVVERRMKDKKDDEVEKIIPLNGNNKIIKIMGKKSPSRKKQFERSKF